MYFFNTDDLIQQVEGWAYNRDLHNADSSKQFLKVVEETGEIARALVRANERDLEDAIGDVMVTLIILAMQNKMSVQVCLNRAYDEIKDRTGEMVNGVFVKSSDLK